MLNFVNNNKNEKYIHSIPSRKYILKHLTKRKQAINREELACELNIEGKTKIEALRRRLGAMERDGQLVFSRNRYTLPENLKLLKGVVIGHRNGYGFLRIQGHENDLYLSPEQMNFCIHGDQVLAQRINCKNNCKNRSKARIIRVLKKNK